MPDNQITRLKLEFTIASGPEVTEFFTLDTDTLHAARRWLARQKNIDLARFSGWLLDKGAKLDREDGPAVIRVFADGTYTESWYRANLVHCDNGPARKELRPDGSSLREWWTNGMLNRKDGPASIEISSDGTTEHQWWVNGKRIKSETLADLTRIPGITILPPPQP